MGKKGNNSHGNENEKNMVVALNGKKYVHLNLNLKKFIKYIANCEGEVIDDDTVIYASYEKSNRLKQDFYIGFNGKIYGISLKMGMSNSTHQEKCEDFIEWLKKDCNIEDESLFDDIRILIWSDGTTDGTGKFEDRLTEEEYIVKYPGKREKIQQVLKENEEALIKRDLFIGKYNSKVDYIYHGTKEDGSWISAENMIEYHKNNPVMDKRKAFLRLGRMTMQVYNRSLNGNNEKKRGNLQIKYSRMRKDFSLLMHSEDCNIGTFQGESEEYRLCRKMNRNKNHSFWKKMGLTDNTNLYVVRVTQFAYSSLVGRRVKPKADLYIIDSKIENDFLLKKEYVITDVDIKNVEHNVIHNKSISVKREGSKTFSYQKLSKKSFVQLFKNYISNCDMFFIGILLYNDRDSINLNGKIISDLGKTEYDVVTFFNEKFKRKDIAIYSVDDVSMIKAFCKEKVKNVINSKKVVKDKIFSGKGVFDEPYFVNYIYKENELTSKVIPEKFTVAEGSGRHKGKYCIKIGP